MNPTQCTGLMPDVRRPDLGSVEILRGRRLKSQACGLKERDSTKGLLSGAARAASCEG